MNNSWWQELMHFFLQGMTLKQLIHMLIILIILIIVMPVSVKEWINLHSPEILPHYWMYYILLFCVSYVLNGVVKWSTKTGHRVRVFSSIDFPIRLVVTHHYIRAVLVRCNIQRYSPLLRELHR
ncbi:hypothetical protein G692_04728 [Escherichia coli HVH 16 (4-7649002)]|nr:hypothetical protein G692_04728 [Escherichia coli HVH 16 (4-7649002)]